MSKNETEEVKDWTAEDAMRGGVIVSEDGRMWTITGVDFDGAVGVTAEVRIEPGDRHHWKFFRPRR